MNKRELSLKVGITQRHLDYLIKAERNASSFVATRLEKATGVSRETWVFGTPAQRQAAWKKFQKETKK